MFVLQHVTLNSSQSKAKGFFVVVVVVFVVVFLLGRLLLKINNLFLKEPIITLIYIFIKTNSYNINQQFGVSKFLFLFLYLYLLFLIFLFNKVALN